MASAGPLDGIVVLDISTILAGPLAAQVLGDYGADVIKIEHPARGDGMRGHGPSKDGVPLWWSEVARNKRTIGLYLGDPAGAEVFKKLVETADVVIENFRPGTLERWGIGWMSCRRSIPGSFWPESPGGDRTDRTPPVAASAPWRRR
jgi:crotonobetainyl-CoA:carnitine CoA-transferase CaiB-like acyl-CoA transferase